MVTTKDRIHVSAINDDPAWRVAWVRLAERACQADRATARRLVFCRWLAETDRLTERPVAKCRQ
jgi:hypothetical protein